MDQKVAKIEVEKSEAIANVGNIDIQGLEEIPTSIIPVPFYKLVQPGTTNVALSDGKDATPGSIYMMDSGEAEMVLKFALLRAKRIHREFTNDRGELVNTISIGMLGINLANYSPFILNVPVSSFSSFGRLMKQLKDKKAKTAWEYPIRVSSDKQEEMKNTSTGTKMVKYYVLKFDVSPKPFGEDDINIFNNAYREFAGTLDKSNETDKKEEEPVREVEEAEEVSPNDIPF